jgi:hypothetical protein
VEKIALIPEKDIPELERNKPSIDGEDMVEDKYPDSGGGTGNGSGFVTLVPPSPVRFDLLHPPKGRRLAKFLNEFEEIPAGAYGKIRVYYSRVEAELFGDITVVFHPTANYHFDIHFVHGNLVIPVATEAASLGEGWVRLFRVKIQFVGLKLKVIGKNVMNRDDWFRVKVILRPQVFAEFVPPLLYSVAGRATNVAKDGTSGDFDIHAAGHNIPAVFTEWTSWAFSENVLGNGRTVDVGQDLGIEALRDDALVDAVGEFPAGSPVLEAKEISLTFPLVVTGTITAGDTGGGSGWNLDNTFVLGPLDNVVFPAPDRAGARYDNNANLDQILTDSAIVEGAQVTARGYDATGGVEAYWISVGP